MTYSRLALAALFALALALSGCNKAATGASACEPVNAWGGPVFACGGGGGSSASDDDSDIEMAAEDGEDDSDLEPEPEPEDFEDGDDDSDSAFEEAPAITADDDFIQTRDPIDFEGNRVSSDSEAVLYELAQFLDSNPDIAVIRIEVSPSSRKKKARRQAKKRASSVRKYLIKQGVSSRRVKAKGLKSPGDSDVEIKIVKRR